MQGSFTVSQSDTEMGRRMDKGTVLSHFIPKVFGVKTPLFKHQKYFIH